MSLISQELKNILPINISTKEILDDYLLANISRQLSIQGRKEVLNGRAKFGIFGDGKEIAQIVYAKFFKKGDWRSGYYRDQTFLLATGMTTPEEFFAQLYGITDTTINPSNGGRSFNNHFGTRSLDDNGNWKNLVKQKNSTSDISPTAGQMPRMLGLALASKLFRENKELDKYPHLSRNGNEVAFGTIGDASTSEGHFFEIVNAAGVMQIPLSIAVWDDGYGISVEKKLQTIKASISETLKGFEKKDNSNGILLYKVKGWDYLELYQIFKLGIDRCRNEHIPVLFHIEELTQPLGHSTSGSHERYKDNKRLAWEEEFDGIKKMREWILHYALATKERLDLLEKEAVDQVNLARITSWETYQKPMKKERDVLVNLIRSKNCICGNTNEKAINIILSNLLHTENPISKDLESNAKRILRYICHSCKEKDTLVASLTRWINNTYLKKFQDYNAYVQVESERSALNVQKIKPVYLDNAALVPGREILRKNYDILLKKHPLLVIFGEDVGKLGGVNQTYEDLQKQYGKHRVFDTGLRETSIIGKGIGLALRGFRPIAEIQYVDYLLYGLQTLSDDLATTHWRTAGGQAAPLIISTRGHRFEGIWHAGSPLSMIINSIRGIYVCVPRNMTQAAGLYNTLLEGDDPALVIEPLNGYRLREYMPANTGEYKLPLGMTETINEGTDLTLVTYGSCVKIAQDAVIQLKEFDIHVELIDVQTLLPFDLTDSITESIKKTNRVLFFDEDVPGGATAYMMQKVLEEQGAYHFLDSPPRTLTAKEHRPAYSTDGDYYSNPNMEDVFEKVYEIMHEVNPQKYPKLY